MCELMYESRCENETENETEKDAQCLKMCGVSDAGGSTGGAE